MVAPGGLGEHGIDHPELEQVGASDLEGFGGNRCLGGIPPEDRGTGLGTGHGIDTVLEHQEPIGDTDAEGPSGAPFPDHRGDDRHPQPKHFPQVHGDRLALTLLLGQKPRIGTGSVDEADDRKPETIGVLHQAERLAIPPR